MDSRKYFVNQVADTIRKKHSKDKNGSFIFGISGKWGEGKTHFLDALSDELKETKDDEGKFEVFTINPWKFASDSDNTSFLRNFLKTLSKGLNESYIIESELKALDFDTSETSIRWGGFFWFVVVLFIWSKFFYTLDSSNSTFHTFLVNWKFVITILFLPLFLAVIGKIFTIQRSNHAISTIDQFDDLLTKIIECFNRENKKIIVFVDDLDRVTPEVAHDVLDNLRTFFDKPNISFVVTGDHTVLERYLGTELLPEGDSPERGEEGRRFLKKIFNVYWRLPLPLDQEVEHFVNEKFTENTLALEKILPEEKDRGIFASHLKKFFGKNYRQIIRFIDTTIFTFDIIHRKLEGSEDSQKRFFKELADKPLLVIRILMIQELCAPLFDRILDEQKILRDLEYAVEKKDTGKINVIIDTYKKELSLAQSSFIKSFLYEEPRFYKGSSWTVSDIRTFLFLAADSSFSDQRGMSAEDFTNTLATADPAQIREVLSSSGDENLEADARAVTEQLPVVADPPTRANQLKALAIALSELPREYSVHKIFVDKLTAVDMTFLNGIPTVEKNEAINSLWRWLDLVNDPSIFSDYEAKFNFTNNVTDLDGINLDKPGIFSSSIITNWLKNFYTSDTLNSLDRMSSFYPKLNLEKVKENMATIESTLITDLIRENNDLREKRFNIITDFTPNGLRNLKEKVFEQVIALNSDITKWAFSKVGQKDVWEKPELEEQMVKILKDPADFSSFTQGISFVIAEKNIDSEKAWKEILSHTKLIGENIAAFVNQQYQSFAPSDKQAVHLMDIFVQKIKISNEEEQKILLPFVRKEQWPWLNLNNYPLSTQLADIGKTDNVDLKKIFEETLQTWGQKIEVKKAKKK